MGKCKQEQYVNSRRKSHQTNLIAVPNYNLLHLPVSSARASTVVCNSRLNSGRDALLASRERTLRWLETALAAPSGSLRRPCVPRFPMSVLVWASIASLACNFNCNFWHGGRSVLVLGRRCREWPLLTWPQRNQSPKPPRLPCCTLKSKQHDSLLITETAVKGVHQEGQANVGKPIQVRSWGSEASAEHSINLTPKSPAA